MSTQNQIKPSFKDTANVCNADIINKINKPFLSPEELVLLQEIFDEYHKVIYDSTRRRAIESYILKDIFKPVCSYYGGFMPSFNQWETLVLKLDELGIKNILGIACGKGGRESILYHISKFVLNEPFNMILTDGHMGKTKPTEINNHENSIDLLPVEHLCASKAIVKYPTVDAYIACMLPMDSHSDSPDDECPGLSMAEIAYQTGKPIISIDEGKEGCCGTDKYWEFVSNNLENTYNEYIKNQNWGVYFQINIYQKPI